MKPPQLGPPSRSVAVVTGGPFASAMFLERVDSGVVLVDLGWSGARDALRKEISKLGATTENLRAVFLTHSHRDHIAAWPEVKHVPIFLAAAEVPLLFGEQEHAGMIPRLADRLNDPNLPTRDDLTIRPFDRDTFYVFGVDTVRVFLVPGHTAGSAAYLIHGNLYAGDAISQTWRRGFVPALPVYSEDADQARRSLESLKLRLAPYVVNTVCTAHLECSAVNEKFWTDVLGK